MELARRAQVEKEGKTTEISPVVAMHPFPARSKINSQTNTEVFVFFKEFPRTSGGIPQISLLIAECLAERVIRFREPGLYCGQLGGAPGLVWVGVCF
jgi:hypothetical protein